MLGSSARPKENAIALPICLDESPKSATKSQPATSSAKRTGTYRLTLKASSTSLPQNGQSLTLALLCDCQSLENTLTEAEQYGQGILNMSG